MVTTPNMLTGSQWAKQILLSLAQYKERGGETEQMLGAVVCAPEPKLV